ncbi:RagB/SusD family nutrient uptake outer membrane protein [Sphingobacterium siyangense]|uniref:RagB/SusD family nutrient uptake outer membrane protein n=1 Tax=Sphingobacterium siyangense TaxID=459529 RepID=UPI001962618D|nr:RagB/SusD family nutrient uptake outer membrane protein [Sphingobacterium siyangense]QRY57185.1 RagB/SusD family nutrient uptake outer membrane protein [Sphingobacterium siyangense]
MKRKILFLILSAFMYLASSCSKFLDIEPVSSATDENFWKTQEDANSATNAMYALLRKALNQGNGMAFYAYGDLLTDEITSSTHAEFAPIVNMQLNTPVAASETYRPAYQLRRYDTFYQAIDQANRVIQKLPKMDENAFDNVSTRDYYIGEAYFVRAFAYFYMARVWGTVPIITESVLPIDAVNLPASKESDVLDQSQVDLSKALALLKWSNIDQNDFALRANTGAALALQAHLSAWRGEYADCIEAAKSVLESGEYSFVGRDSLNYRSIYQGKSNEGIFEISQNSENEGTSSGIGYFSLAGPYFRFLTDPFLRISQDYIKTLFKDSNDKRFKSVFDIAYNSNYALCTKYANVKFSSNASNANAIFKNNIIIFRYSDIKLLMAEGLAATGKNSSAETILNEIRTQAGLPAYTKEEPLIEAIFSERARELFLEGHRYYDLVRLYRHFNVYKFPEGKMNQSQFNAKKYLWPFDPSLLSTNPMLNQTPYWGTVNM